MSFSKHKYRILFPILSIPLAYIATAATLYFYDEFIRTKSDPNDMRLDSLGVLFAAGAVSLVLFPIVGYFLGRKADSAK